MEFTSMSSFKKYKENPSYLLLIINKYVEVKVLKNTTLSGFINSIDPIDHSIILLVPHEEKFRTTLIPGHAVVDVCVKEPPPNMNIPSTKSRVLTTCKPERKQKLLQWLKENSLPFSEMDDNLVYGDVTILPPYQTTDIATNNPRLAIQLVKIMNRMPDDYNPA